MRLDSEWIQSVSQSVSQLLDLGLPPLCTTGVGLGLKTSALKHEQAVLIHWTTHVIWSASFVSIPQPSLFLSNNDDTQRECV